MLYLPDVSVSIRRFHPATQDKTSALVPQCAHSSLRRHSGFSVLVLLSFALTSCISGPAPKLYLLEAPVSELSGENEGGQLVKSLGITAVGLPDYVSGDRIASLNGSGQVSYTDAHRWAEDPETAITRLLSGRLRHHSGGTVLIEPWPRDYEPVARVQVVFDRLLREPGGGVDMAGEVQLLSGNGRNLLRTVPFNIVLYGGTTDIPVFFKATAQGIDDIARSAVDALIGMRRPS